MKLWKLTQDDVNGQETYDSCIVAAKTEEEARLISPTGTWEYKLWNCHWCNKDYAMREMKVEFIGEAASHIEKGVVLASYNAC